KLGDQPPRQGVNLVVDATAPAAWVKYLLLFGAQGEAHLLDEVELGRRQWTVTADGPSPAQTILLVAVPQKLSDDQRRQLSRDLGAIADRNVDQDSQIVWTPTSEPTI